MSGYVLPCHRPTRTRMILPCFSNAWPIDPRFRNPSVLFAKIGISRRPRDSNAQTVQALCLPFSRRPRETGRYWTPQWHLRRRSSQQNSYPDRTIFLFACRSCYVDLVLRPKSSQIFGRISVETQRTGFVKPIHFYNSALLNTMWWSWWLVQQTEGHERTKSI